MASAASVCCTISVKRTFVDVQYSLQPAGRPRRSASVPAAFKAADLNSCTVEDAREMQQPQHPYGLNRAVRPNRSRRQAYRRVAERLEVALLNDPENFDWDQVEVRIVELKEPRASTEFLVMKLTKRLKQLHRQTLA